MLTAKGATATEVPTAAQETNEASGDTNNRDTRSNGNTIYRRDISNNQDANKSRPPC